MHGQVFCKSHESVVLAKGAREFCAIKTHRRGARIILPNKAMLFRELCLSVRSVFFSIQCVSSLSAFKSFLVFILQVLLDSLVRPKHPYTAVLEIDLYVAGTLSNQQKTTTHMLSLVYSIFDIHLSLFLCCVNQLLDSSVRVK